MTRASGKDLLAAVILGQEVTCRLGLAFRNQKAKGGYFTMGFLPASVIGGFGTTSPGCSGSTRTPRSPQFWATPRARAHST